MAVDRAKKLKTAESVASEGGLERIDGGLVLSIEKLQAIQEELDKVDEEANDRVFEVEQKYNEIRRPVYVRRCDIIKRIPDFWLSAFLSHPALGDLLNETDQQIFKFLSSLDVGDLKDVKTGYTITFNFSANPYFKDTKLTKTYLFNGDGTTKVSGTTINWKEGMENIANGKVQEKGGKRPISEESFFSWFSESQQEDSLGGFMDEVAEIIKEDLWPNPLKYFNNNEPDEENIDGEEETDDEHSNDDDVTAEEDD